MKLKLGLCQMKVTADKAENLRHARELIDKAAAGGAELVMLPEMFNCPYENAAFPVYAEPAGGESWQMLSRAAKENGVYLVGGSVPELEDGKIYNTSFIFDREGRELARHRKVHLFDIDVPGGQRFKESDTLTAGDQITLVDTPWGKLGVAICFDIRFAEFFRVMGDAGAVLIAIPAAFNMTTGPAHWDLTFRMRAIDQLPGCGPLGQLPPPYGREGARPGGGAGPVRPGKIPGPDSYPVGTAEGPVPHGAAGEKIILRNGKYPCFFLQSVL